MKNILLPALLLLFVTSAHCQTKNKRSPVPELPRKGSSIEYTGTVSLDTSRSKELLFHNVQEWYKHNFQSSDNRLTIDNADNGRISGTGIIHAHGHEKEIEPKDIFFTVDVLVSKGGYQYRVDSIYSFENKDKFYYSDMYNEELYPIPKPKWATAYRQAMLINMNTSLLAVIDRLKKDMAKK